MVDDSAQWISKSCLKARDERLLHLYMKLLERRKVLFFLAPVPATFAGLWTLLSSSGVVGSPLLAIVLFISSVLFALILSLLRLIRWTMLDWLVEKCLITIREYDPKIIIGVGRGGAHIAAMLCHKLSGQSEPAFLSLDRIYVRDKMELSTTLSDLSKLQYDKIKSRGKVLLVTAEVHGGKTLGEARRLLKIKSIEHRAFAVLKSSTTNTLVDYYALETDSRSLIPWKPSQIRQHIRFSSS